MMMYNLGLNSTSGGVMKYFLQSLVLLLFVYLSLAAQSNLSRNDGIAAYRSGDFDKAAMLLENAVNADKSDHLALAGGYFQLQPMETSIYLRPVPNKDYT